MLDLFVDSHTIIHTNTDERNKLKEAKKYSRDPLKEDIGMLNKKGSMAADTDK
jgi:hypothetical protein